MRSFTFRIALAAFCWGALVSMAYPSKSLGDEPGVNPAQKPTQSTQPANSHQPAKAVELRWYSDYFEACDRAKVGHKKLLVYFYESVGEDAARRAFEEVTLKDAGVQNLLQRYVLLKFPKEAEIVSEGKKLVLIKHAAFQELNGHAGIAVIDYQNKADEEKYGAVISALPFTTPKYYQTASLQILLDLPDGSISQRTMIWAVRLHPEKPASTQGEFHPVLIKEAESHSDHQASIRTQGHHNWDSRFQRINRLLGFNFLSQEVCAESWPNKGIVDAAVDCVDSWRQSEGHWHAVSGNHPVYGYDIKRGKNGIWYATGIFGLRR